MLYYACAFSPGKQGAHHVVAVGERQPICGTHVAYLAHPNSASSFEDVCLSMENCYSSCERCRKIMAKRKNEQA